MAIEITAEVQKAIDAAVAEATAELAAEVTEVRGKNAFLSKELKNHRAGKTGPTVEEVEKMEQQIDTLKGDLAKAHKDLKAANTNAEKATKALEAESGFTQKLLIDNGLTAELTKHNVTNPALLKAAQALLRANVKIEIDGDNRIAKFGDKPLADAVKEWAGSEEGKHFVTASSNSGGGAGGGAGGTGNQKTKTRAEFDGMGQSERAVFAKEGGRVVDAAA